VNSFSFWQRWLLGVGVIVTVFGLVMALLNGTALLKPFNRQIDPVFWADGALPQAAIRFRGWVYGAWGATVAGWGLIVAWVAHTPFRKRERWAWNGLVAGLALWYGVDTAISLYFRVYFNAVFNSGLLILILLPMAFTRQSFAAKTQTAGPPSAGWQTVRPDVARGVYGKTLLTEGVKMVLTRVEPGGKFAPHRDDYGHLFYFISGQGSVWIEDRTFEAQPGLTLRVAAGETHAYENVGPQDLMLISVNVPSERLGADQSGSSVVGGVQGR